MPNGTGGADYILGLDIGVASVGWVLVSMGDQGKPIGILRIGSLTFEAGVEGDIKSGRDEARGAARREARLPRRMHWRRQRRRRKILGILQRAGLLPPGETGSPQAIHDYLLEVDADLRGLHPTNGDRVAAQVLPYRLRAEALDRGLRPCELGRAFYHLAQRRGFLSNRKSAKKDEDEGVVKQGISDLHAAMEATGAKTLGQYFAGLDPEAEKIRRQWTARQMYIDEFEAIWAAQSAHHTDRLTPALKEELYRAIFFQRPLKSARHLIGRCELVKNARRAAMADRLVQRFRILQKLNDLRIRPPDGAERPLTEDERSRLLDALLSGGDLAFGKIKSKKLLGLPKGTKFNFEQDDEEKKLPGHRTDERLRPVFGERWDTMSDEERDAIVLEVLSFQDADALARRGTKAWGLDESAARELADTKLEPGYASHSRKALRQLVDRMEGGTQYATARKELFPESFETREPLDRLPPVLKKVPSLRNPAVARALTELRKLVNEIVRVHGKPSVIRIELARDLKRSRKQREQKSREIDQQTKARDNARAKILDEAGLSEPRRPDIEKALLWEECGGRCPYTDRSIPFASLFGDAPQFDVEHILPFSRSLDNSFLNKTLCYHEENREHKRNRTPFEAYSHDSKRYGDILARVRRFAGKAARLKLRRFEMEEIPEDFVSRQLNDTRYASRLAGDYLALLYGGRSDASGTQRIQISTGGITAHLRNEWMLYSILSDGPKKSRSDHRHHAVDALVVALAEPSIINRLQKAAERASAEGRRLFGSVREPWPGLLKQARESVDAIKVSRRQNKKIAGVLHAVSLYSKPMPQSTGGTVVHIRKELHKLSVTDLKRERIVDPVIRRIVHERWQREGGGDPKRVFADRKTHPTLRSGDGRCLPIHRVRLKVGDKPWKIGEGATTRYVTSKAGSNHHTEIVAVLRADGSDGRWEDHLVSRMQAHNRRRARPRLPIVQTEFGPGRQFRFSLASGEFVQMQDDLGAVQLYRVRGISSGDMEFSLHADARTAKELQEAKARVRAGADKLRKRGARKVRVTYLGEIVPAND